MSRSRQHTAASSGAQNWQAVLPRLPAHTTLTEEQGSSDSSLAATRATQPSVTLFRYTMGVLPMTSLRRAESVQRAGCFGGRRRRKPAGLAPQQLAATVVRSGCTALHS